MNDMQRCGVDEVLDAIHRNENISVLLVKREAISTKLEQIVSIAEERGIKVIRGSENDLWRMSRDNSEGIPDVLGLVGRAPKSTSVSYTHQTLPTKA